MVRAAKISKANRAIFKVPDKPSHYFKRLADFWIDQQDARAKEFKYKGFMSPSSQLRFTMCMEEYFERIDKPLYFVPDTLMTVNGGSLLHLGFGVESDKAKLNWPEEPRYDDEWVTQWRDRIRPEVPIADGYFRAKIDNVLTLDDLPAVFDLKTTWMANGTSFTDEEIEFIIKALTPYAESDAASVQKILDKLTAGSWQKFKNESLPKPEHIVQISVYMNRMRANKLFSKQPRMMGLGYFNVLAPFLSQKGYIEYWYDYMHYRERTNLLVEYMIRGLVRFREKEPVYCKYPECYKGHGSRR